MNCYCLKISHNKHFFSQTLASCYIDMVLILVLKRRDTLLLQREPLLRQMSEGRFHAHDVVPIDVETNEIGKPTPA